MMKFCGTGKMASNIFILIISLVISSAANAAFDSGSTGADGAFSPTSNTVLQIPDNGIFNFTTVNIPTGVTVTFTKNPLNTPITILATGNIAIAGTINLNGGNASYIVAGVGGPGGFDGGLGGVAYKDGRRGEGPGGGGGGSVKTSYDRAAGGGAGGGFGTNGAGGGSYNYAGTAAGGPGGTAYGNERILPMIGGSGGGGGGGTTTYIGGGGGGGGGAIVIASSGTITISGAISANGGNGNNGEGSNCDASSFYCGGGGGAGSGGSIRLIANTISGNGNLSANGGNGGAGYSSADGGAGGAGRIRFEATNIIRSGGTSTPPMTYGVPSDIVPSTIPTLVISSIGGVSSPIIPKGSFSSPDITLPFNIQNPVTVIVSAGNIPSGTSVSLKSIPATGSISTATGTLVGTDASSSVSMPITISKSIQSVLTASVTFQLASLGIGPIYAEGEPVEKVRVEAAIGKNSTITYITASGKEIPANQLKS